jgi:hypothetical protein
MKIKTSDLQGAALDWAVASICGYTNLRFHREPPLDGGWIMTPPRKAWGPVLLAEFSPSTDWAAGGPIIERERIRLDPRGLWCAAHDSHEFTWESGTTPLIAAMRCYVASKMGSEVEVPDGI